MSSFIDNFSPKEWEAFCEVMLRQHYGAKNFYSVPDEDRGDLGLEFYTIEGTLFQCYYPKHGVEMSVYKSRIKNKINADLNKLKINEKEIGNLLDDIVINQWVLLVPEDKSKDLIAYCNKKKKEAIKKNISYIDTDEFSVKIETANSYPEGKKYAQGVYSKAIDIPLSAVTARDRQAWKIGHSEFSNNIERKSTTLMGQESDRFQERVVTRYIQIEKFLETLRTDHPDLHELVEDSARAQLEDMQEASVLENQLDTDFVKSIVAENRKAFSKHSKFMSDHYCPVNG